MASTPDKLTTVVSTKGQVILPKAIRERRHWAPGTRLAVEDTPEGVLLRPVPLFAPTNVAEVFGLLAWAGETKTVEEMDAAVATEAKRRARH
jgi:AbrB family looped-hinge helix DNA binding protein